MKPKTPVAARLIEIRGSRSRGDFAQELGQKEGTYVSYEKGVSAPSVEFLQQLASLEGINLHWLLTGEGEMYLLDEPPAQALDATLMETIVITIGEFLAQNPKVKIEPEKLWLVYMLCYRKIDEIKDRYPPEQMRIMLKEELRDLLYLATK